jgi:cytochrome P450
MSNVDTARATAPADVPSFDIDVCSDEVIADPYPIYKELRDAGPVVWLERNQMFGFPRYRSLVQALTDWSSVSSAKGCAFNDIANNIGNSSLHSDPPRHEILRRAESRPLTPTEVAKLEPAMREPMDRKVDELIERGGTFDGVEEIANLLPLQVVAEMVGLDEPGKEKLLAWGEAGFNSFGPMDNPRTPEALQIMAGYVEYAQEAVPSKLKPGSWGEVLFQTGQDLGLTEQDCRELMNDYVYPALDTTIQALAEGLEYFGENPDQWEMLRADRSLMPGAVSEIMRLSSPIQWQGRWIKKDYVVDGVTLPAGHRALMMFGAANRDERQFPDPERFDITRPSNEQVGFGHGKHACLGMPLARLEISVTYGAIADRVKRIEVGRRTRLVNNLLQGLSSIETTFHT